MDLSVGDVDAAGRSYRELFGWTLTVHHSPMGTYVSAATDDGDVGGMMAHDPERRAAGVPAAWTVVFAVDDIDAAHQHVLDLGGTSYAGPFGVPGGDRIAYVTDPAGASFAIMQSSQAQGGMVWGKVGAAGWVECQARDPERATAFYETLFDWQATAATTDHVVFEHHGSQIAGLMQMPAQVPAEVSSYWMPYWTVDDVDATVSRANELVATVVVPPMTMEEMRFAVVEDPQGAVFGLIPEQRSS